MLSSCGMHSLLLLWTQALGLELQWLRQLDSAVAVPGLQNTVSIVVVNGLSCSIECGVFLDQGLNPCPLHWQVGSLPLYHQGSHSVIIDLVIIAVSFLFCPFCSLPPFLFLPYFVLFSMIPINLYFWL